MQDKKKLIALVMYAHLEHYPPVINAINILAKDFDLLVFCRHQGYPELGYPSNVKLFRLGKLQSCRKKELQHPCLKIAEYLSFCMKVIFYIRFYRCQLIYSYDMHGLASGFFASRLGKKLHLVYHNHDLVILTSAKGLSYVIKRLEVYLARHADKIVFPDINRARFFQEEAKLAKFPDIVINASLRQGELPPNRLTEALKENGLNPVVKPILYQGTIGEGAALINVVQSMAFWPENTVLVLCGHVFPDYLEKMLKVARGLNLDKRIIQIPWVDYPQLRCYTVGAYLGLALFRPLDINRHFAAGASNKIYEYMALGIPVLVNDTPSFREALDDSMVYFCNAESPDSIAQTVNLAITDKETYLGKSRSCRQAHLTRLNYEIQFQPIVEYLKGCLLNRKRR